MHFFSGFLFPCLDSTSPNQELFYRPPYGVGRRLCFQFVCPQGGLPVVPNFATRCHDVHLGQYLPVTNPVSIPVPFPVGGGVPKKFIFQKCYSPNIFQ